MTDAPDTPATNVAPRFDTLRVGVLAVEVEGHPFRFGVRVVRDVDGQFRVLMSGGLSEPLPSLDAALERAARPEPSPPDVEGVIDWRPVDAPLGPDETACPTCAAPLTFDPRAPDVVCPACTLEATDRSGRPVRFSNAEMSGGVVGRYADGTEYTSDECLVRGVLCRAAAHRLGGIVLRPITDTTTTAQLERLGRDPQGYFDGWDFRTTATRDRALALAEALVDRLVRPNLDVATSNYDDDDPPGGCHFVPERWLGPDEDAAGRGMAALLEVSTSLFRPPPLARIEACLREAEVVPRAAFEVVAVPAWRSSVAYAGQLAAEIALSRLGDRRFQQRGSPRSQAEFARLLPLLSDALPRTLIAMLVATLFDLSAELGAQLSERPFAAIVRERIQHQLACLEDERALGLRARDSQRDS
jgi:hypothetical protein